MALEKPIFLIQKKENLYRSILIFYAIFDIGSKTFSTTYPYKVENKQIKTQF